jgi:hypothetical protein
MGANCAGATGAVLATAVSGWGAVARLGTVAAARWPGSPGDLGDGRVSTIFPERARGQVLGRRTYGGGCGSLCAAGFFLDDDGAGRSARRSPETAPGRAFAAICCQAAARGPLTWRGVRVRRRPQCRRVRYLLHRAYALRNDALLGGRHLSIARVSFWPRRAHAHANADTSDSVASQVLAQVGRSTSPLRLSRWWKCSCQRSVARCTMKAPNSLCTPA